MAGPYFRREKPRAIWRETKGIKSGRRQNRNPFRFVARGGHLKHALVVRTRRVKVESRTFCSDQAFLLAVMGELEVVGDSRNRFRAQPEIGEGECEDKP